MKYAIDIYAGDDWGGPPVESTGYVFASSLAARIDAEARLADRWDAEERSIGARIVSDDAELTSTGDPSVEFDVTPASLGWPI